MAVTLPFPFSRFYSDRDGSSEELGGDGAPEPALGRLADFCARMIEPYARAQAKAKVA